MTPEHDAVRRDRHAVLDVFGLKLEVSNPRLAELLTMNAKDALTTDLRGLASKERLSASDVSQAAPGVMMSATTPHDEEVARARKEYRQRVAAAGDALGFETRADGLWISRTGTRVLSRSVERSLSLAAATHFVGEMNLLCQQREDAASCSVLFVTCDTQTAEVFTLVIRQRRLQGTMRTIVIDALEDMMAMQRDGTIDHQQVTRLLAPDAGIDVTKTVALLQRLAGASGESPDAV